MQGGINDRVHTDGTAAVGQCFPERPLHIARRLEANPLGPHHVGHAREVRVTVVGAKRHHAGFLLFDAHEIERHS
jgi:hypothetical protein